MKYLVPTDFSPVSQNAIKQAINWCSITGGNLFLLHLVKNKNEFKLREKQLNAELEKLKKNTSVEMTGHVVIGDIFTDIGKIAEYHGADLVMMGTHGVDMMQKIFGSNSIKIITHSVVPFVVFQEKAPVKRLKKIVMPVSFDVESVQVTRLAVELSKAFDAEIHLIGRLHSDEWMRHKVNSNIALVEKYMMKNKVKSSFELADVSKSDFQDYLLDYCKTHRVDLLATTYYTDSMLPMFEKFVQHLIVNDQKIPVLCVNAQSLSSVSSQFSFMTV